MDIYFVVLGLCNRPPGNVSVSFLQLLFGISPVVLSYNIKVGVAAMLKDWVWFPAGNVWPVERSETHGGLRDTRLATGCTGQLWKFLTKIELRKTICYSEKAGLNRANIAQHSSESSVQWTDHSFFFSPPSYASASQKTQVCMELCWTWVSHVVFPWNREVLSSRCLLSAREQTLSPAGTGGEKCLKTSKPGCPVGGFNEGTNGKAWMEMTTFSLTTVAMTSLLSIASQLFPWR